MAVTEPQSEWEAPSGDLVVSADPRRRDTPAQLTTLVAKWADKDRQARERAARKHAMGERPSRPRGAIDTMAVAGYMEKPDLALRAIRSLASQQMPRTEVVIVTGRPEEVATPALIEAIGKRQFARAAAKHGLSSEMMRRRRKYAIALACVTSLGMIANLAARLLDITKPARLGTVGLPYLGLASIKRRDAVQLEALKGCIRRNDATRLLREKLAKRCGSDHAANSAFIASITFGNSAPKS